MLVGLLTMAVFYVALFSAAFWFTNRKRHPSRGKWNAFFQFIGIVGGTIIAAILVLTSHADRRPEYAGARPGGVVMLVAIIPAWRYALARIAKSLPQPSVAHPV